MNIISIFLAGLSTFIIGFLAHGPVAGKIWMRLANIHPTGNEKFSDMTPQLFWNLLVNLITAFVLSGIINFSFSALGGGSILKGILISVWAWFGFVVTSSSIEVIWMGRKLSHWLFECIVSLICFIAMGTILAM